MPVGWTAISTVENHSVGLAAPRFSDTPLLSLRSAHVSCAPTCWPSVDQALGRKCMKNRRRKRKRETERPREREEERLDHHERPKREPEVSSTRQETARRRRLEYSIISRRLVEELAARLPALPTRLRTRRWGSSPHWDSERSARHAALRACRLHRGRRAVVATRRWRALLTTRR